MKLVYDDGTVLDEFPDDCALLVFHPNGDVDAQLPKFGAPEDVVPEHMVKASQVLVFLSDSDNLDEIERFFRRKLASTH